MTDPRRRAGATALPDDTTSFPQELRAEGDISGVAAVVRITMPSRTRFYLDQRRRYYTAYSIYHRPRADGYGYAPPPRHATGLLWREGDTGARGSDGRR